MSSVNFNNVENEEDTKSPDKKQIEAEEKEIMLKPDNESTDPISELKVDEGPVKAALSSQDTEQGREVKPKFIPIGAIKMPGFFMRNSDKNKEEDAVKEENEKNEDGTKPKRHRLQFLHSCPLTQFLHHPKNENDQNNTERKNRFPLLNISIPKIMQRGNKSPDVALASVETLDEKQDKADGMETVKLDGEENEADKVETRLPLKERIRQGKFTTDDIIVAMVVFLLLLTVIISVVVTGTAVPPPSERPLRLGKYMTTITTCGPVEGVRSEGVYKFYSIPYAVPPINEKRFTNAVPLNNASYCWNGTLDVRNPGPLCLQFLENGTIVGEEDCLTLDIVTPHVKYSNPLPVVVLIGANSLAGGISPAQPSALYSRTKEVLFVRPNFRLGPFGFLALDVLSKTKYPETSGNYALSDLLACLQWIKYNIRHFGGDSDSVTLLGHRAGATLTAALTTVRNSHKLYTSVWLSSPSVIFPGESLDQAQKDNEQFKLISKCSDADCLRRITSTEILAATPDIWLRSTIGALPLNGEFQHSWLVLDGDLLRTHAYESWDAQKSKNTGNAEKSFKNMVFGTTQHSGHSELLHKKHLNWTSEIVEKMVNDSIIGEKNMTADVFTHFNKTYEGLVSLISAIRTLCPVVSLARLRLSAQMYVVLGDGAGGGKNGTGMAGVDADVEAILGTFDSEVPEQRRFMAAMQHLFYYYVWHGNLPGPDTGLKAVGQDVLPLNKLHICDLLISKDIVPRYAHSD